MSLNPPVPDLTPPPIELSPEFIQAIDTAEQEPEDEEKDCRFEIPHSVLLLHHQRFIKADARPFDSLPSLPTASADLSSLIPGAIP